jgi:hypothetical protein
MLSVRSCRCAPQTSSARGCADSPVTTLIAPSVSPSAGAACSMTETAPTQATRTSRHSPGFSVAMGWGFLLVSKVLWACVERQNAQGCTDLKRCLHANTVCIKQDAYCTLYTGTANTRTGSAKEWTSCGCVHMLWSRIIWISLVTGTGDITIQSSMHPVHSSAGTECTTCYNAIIS